ncbi:MAG: hypothetical protein J6Y32_07710 [Bacteroidales bacterium]|nr:hypothetical protein [Bacteroidales bacterium]
MLAIIGQAVALFGLCGCREVSPSETAFPASVECACTLRMHAPQAEDFADDSLCVFSYNPDNYDYIDSYSRLPYENDVRILLTAGRKKIAVLRGIAPSRITPEDFVTLEALERFCFQLEEEDPAHPFQSAFAELDARIQTVADLSLTPLLSRIRVKSLRADFSGQPYDGARVDSVRVYLTHVNCQCSVLAEEKVSAEVFCHQGFFSPEDNARLRHPEMLIHCLDGTLSPTARQTDLSLYCYPNQNGEEGLGSPYTRLVIECRIAGERFYYPLNVGRGYLKAEGLTEGIARGKSYDFDICLRHLGSRDPDTVLETGTVSVLLSVGPWTEKEERYEDF